MLDGGGANIHHDFGNSGNMYGAIFFWAFFLMGTAVGVIGTADVYYVCGSISFITGTIILLWTTFTKHKNKKHGKN